MNDEVVAKFLAKISVATIVHSEHTVDAMKVIGLETRHTNIIPMGAYDNIYKDDISELRARQKLGIAEDEFVILYFGTIRAYKGVPDLVDALAALNLSNTRLIIAGEGADTSLKQQIEAKDKLKINLIDSFIPDDEVAVYFNACNIVCLPFKKITTSSSALLGMSFSRPVIAPKLGSLLDLPGNVGYLYDPKKAHGLQDTLKLAASKKEELKELGSNAKRYVQTLSWDTTADKTYKLYQETLRVPTNPRS